jgi:hypothetical protein
VGWSAVPSSVTVAVVAPGVCPGLGVVGVTDSAESSEDWAPDTGEGEGETGADVVALVKDCVLPARESSEVNDCAWLPLTGALVVACWVSVGSGFSIPLDWTGGLEDVVEAVLAAASVAARPPSSGESDAAKT